MIQEITNRTWKMNQDMKRKGIFFQDKHVEVKEIEDGKPVGLNSHADRERRKHPQTKR